MKFACREKVKYNSSKSFFKRRSLRMNGVVKR